MTHCPICGDALTVEIAHIEHGVARWEQHYIPCVACLLKSDGFYRLAESIRVPPKHQSRTRSAQRCLTIRP